MPWNISKLRLLKLRSAVKYRIHWFINTTASSDRGSFGPISIEPDNFTKLPEVSGFKEHRLSHILNYSGKLFYPFRISWLELWLKKGMGMTFLSHGLGVNIFFRFIYLPTWKKITDSKYGLFFIIWFICFYGKYRTLELFSKMINL